MRKGFNQDPSKPHVGRKKGVKNKSSVYNKAYIQDLLDGEKDKVGAALEQLRTSNPDAYLKHIKEFMKFVIPQVSAVKIEDETPQKNLSISLDLHEALEDL